MIDEKQGPRRSVLKPDPVAGSVETPWLTGSGRGLMIGVLLVVGVLIVVALVVSALAFRTLYTDVRQDMDRRSRAVRDTEKAAAIKAETKRPIAITRIDSDNPAARLPIGKPAGWIVADDYPAAALRSNTQGAVSIAWTVGSDGLVTDCVTTVSSGHGILDRAACDAISRRGRYPAVEMTAKPRVFERRVVWQIPD